MPNGVETWCCGRTMAEGYRCEGCPYATKAHTLVPRIPEDPNPTPEITVEKWPSLDALHVHDPVWPDK